MEDELESLFTSENRQTIARRGLCSGQRTKLLTMKQDPESFTLERITTPTGVMLLATDAEQRLRAADWETHEDRMRRLLNRHYGKDGYTLTPATRVSNAAEALQRYFDGELAAIDEVVTHTNGTDFQREVWAALRRIPAGETLSYGALAAKIQRPAAVRAIHAPHAWNSPSSSHS